MHAEARDRPRDFAASRRVWWDHLCTIMHVPLLPVDAAPSPPPSSLPAPASATAAAAGPSSQPPQPPPPPSLNHLGLLVLRIPAELVHVRFRFHFTGARDTARADKPEWFYTFVLTMLERGARLLGGTMHRVASQFATDMAHALAAVASVRDAGTEGRAPASSSASSSSATSSVPLTLSTVSSESATAGASAAAVGTDSAGVHRSALPVMDFLVSACV